MKAKLNAITGDGREKIQTEKTKIDLRLLYQKTSKKHTGVRKYLRKLNSQRKRYHILKMAGEKKYVNLKKLLPKFKV